MGRSYSSNSWSEWEGRKYGDRRAPSGPRPPWKLNMDCSVRTPSSRKTANHLDPASRIPHLWTRAETGTNRVPAGLILHSTRALPPAGKMFHARWSEWSHRVLGWNDPHGPPRQNA